VTSREPQGPPPRRSGWQPDVLPGYWQQTIALGPDPNGEGELFATVIRRGEPGPSGHAVLAVHGYTDYFFQTEIADHFAARGFAFYAIDLHKCGRSQRAGQTPHFTTNLAYYDTELLAALQLITADTDGARVCLYGHSAGGLISTLFADRLRRRASGQRLSALVLNSPFFDLQGPAILRSPLVSAILVALAKVSKFSVIRRPTEGGYGSSLHRDYGGEFDYNLEWKPLGGFPVTAAWINAIRRGQSALHRGLDVGVPSLILRSDHSVAEKTPEMARGDAVLDVAQIARWAGCVGNRGTVVPIVDAKHDVFLSLPGPRAAALGALDHWIDEYLESLSATR
jgi:alpha-beta hydrolase superfamily lysophospholipase